MMRRTCRFLLAVPLLVVVIAAAVVAPYRPDSGAAEQAPSTAVSTPAVAISSTVITNDAGVAMRVAPSTMAPVAATLPQGTRLTVIGSAVTAGGFTWWPVKDPETATIGYVRAELLSLVTSPANGASTAVPTETASAPAPTGTETVADTLARVDPNALATLLLTRPFARTELPARFMSPEISGGENDSSLFPGATYEVTVYLNGPEHGEIASPTPDVSYEAKTTITYAIYAHQAAAAEGMKAAQQQIRQDLQGVRVHQSQPPSLVYPTVMLAAAATVQDPKIKSASAAYCLVQVGTILIAGLSQGIGPERTDLDVVDLAQAAVTHLERVAASLAASVPGSELDVTLQAMPPRGSQVNGNTLNATRDVVERRVRALGIVGGTMQTRSSNQIFLRLPGVTDPQRVISVLARTALFEIIDPRGQYLPPGTVVSTILGGPDTVGANTTGTPPANAPIYTTLISGADLQDAFPATGQLGEPVVGFSVKQGGAGKLYRFTSAHIGQPMSIALDKTVVSSPTIRGAISDQGEITGLTPQEVNNLVIELRSGALPVPLQVVQSLTVGADEATVPPAS